MSFPSLTAHRKVMLRAAMRTAQAAGGGEKLKVPASQPELLSRMARIASEPVGPPLEVYTGVLFDALGADALEGSPGGIDVLVTSALFGLVDARTDLIPAYRVSAGSEVSRLGRAGTWWKARLAGIGSELADGRRIVIDARSGAYKSMMPVCGGHVLEVTPVAEREGRRTVISHDAKKYRGLVARALLESGRVPENAREVEEILVEAFEGKLGVELASGKATTTLTIVDAWSEESHV